MRSAIAAATPQTLNYAEFGIPFAQGVSDPFTVWRFGARASATVFDASLITRYRAAEDSALASRADARAVGELKAAAAGLAYLRAPRPARPSGRARRTRGRGLAARPGRQLVRAGVSA
jgi:hypothetical protein